MWLRSFILLLLATTTSCAVIEKPEVNVQVKCGKVNFQCTMYITFEIGCGSVSKVVPKCFPKKSKCTKGVPLSFDTNWGCRITGTFKSNGKKQFVSNVHIQPSTCTNSPKALSRSSPDLEETVVLGQVKCRKATYEECKVTLTYKENCSKVSKVVPNCSPRRSKCVKGVFVSIHTEKGCTVKGMYKNNGKKQTMSKLAISTTTSAPTTISPTTIAPTTIPGGPAEWSDWGDWIESDPASCSCGIGFKFRVRNCFAPSPDACDGDQTETEPCTASESINQQTCEKPTTQG